MYKAKDKSEYSFFDFNQPLGMHMNPENRWIRLAELIPWDEYEEKYASRFKSDTGNVAKPCRMALGALIIQKRLGFSDRELVEEITENPYLQYFIGLPGYQETPPFDASTLVAFRKRIDLDMSQFMNDILLEENKAKQDSENKDPHDKNDNGSSEGSAAVGRKSDKTESPEAADKDVNSGTLIIDATCAPSYIRYPQDFPAERSREKLEDIIFRICGDNGLYRPRTYCREAERITSTLQNARNAQRKRSERQYASSWACETRSGLHRQIYIRRICTSAKRRKASRYDQKAL